MPRVPGETVRLELPNREDFSRLWIVPTKRLDLMDFRAWQTEVVAYLDRLMDRKAAAKGGKGAFLDSLGFSEGFLVELRRRARRPKDRIPLNDVFPILVNLDEPPVIALYEAGRQLDQSLPELPRAQAPPPSSEYSRKLLAQLAEPPANNPILRDAGSLEQLKGFAIWRRLHHLVLSAPCEVLAQASSALHFAAPALSPRILAVVGTALRRTTDFAGARHLLAEARRRARALGDRWAEADATHRLSRVNFEMGDPEGALRRTLEAAGLYAMVRDQAGLGRAILSYGHYLAHLEEFTEAADCLRQAIKTLPDSAIDHKVGAMTNLSRIALEQRDVDEALRWARAAAGLSHSANPGVWLDCTQTRGVLALQLGHTGEAIEAFRKCRDTYREQGIFLECAYVTLWLCSALLKDGKGAEVVELAKEGAWLIGHLRSSGVAAGVMASLANQATAGREISDTFLRSLLEKVEGVRERRRQSHDE